MNVNSSKGALAAVAFSAAACFSAFSPASAEPEKISISFVTVEEDPLTQAMYLLADYIGRSLPGRFDIGVYPASTLFQQSENVPSLTRGNLQFGYVNFSDIAQQIPVASILSAGYVLRDINHQCAVLTSDFGQDLLKQVEEKMGIKVIGQGLVGYRTLVLGKKRKVETPADLANVTIREIGAEPYQFLGEAIGAKPTPIAYSELYLAMQTGTVDAFAGYATAMINTKFYEVSEQFVLTNHLLSADLIGVSIKFWDTLTDDEKAVVQEAGQVASMYETNTRLRAEKTAIEEMKAVGLEITTPNIDAFRKHVKEKYLSSKFAAGWPEGLWDKIEAIPSDPNCTLGG
jgi:TRAP-type C4-dicarboxylate transport system substrate-binding protein